MIKDLNQILVTPLKRIEVLGGDVFHALKCGDSTYAGFGEAYFSWVKSGAVKAWKFHTQMHINLAVPIGNVKFVFFLKEATNPFRVINASVDNYVRITVPPGVWFGFKGCSLGDSLILSIANIEHNESELHRRHVDEIPFCWERL